MTAVFNVEPIGKPRMTQRDKWAQRPVVLRYHAYADNLRFEANKQSFHITGQLRLQFYIPFPPSWSKKKKKEMEFRPHTQKPDIDNLIKAFMDPLAKDDSFVWNVAAVKYWSDKGYIIAESI